MNLTEKDIEQLEAMWEGTLPAMEKDSLLKRLDKDPNFAKAAKKWYKIVHFGFKESEAEQKRQAEIVEHLKALEKVSDNKDTDTQTHSNRFSITKMIKAAAAILLLLLTTWFILPKQSKVLRENLKNLALENDLGVDDEDIHQRWKENYSQEQYAKVIETFPEELPTVNDSLYLLYLGNAYLWEGQTQEAIAVLNQIDRFDDWADYRAVIEWHLALAYVAQKQMDDAKIHLEWLSTTDNDYQQKATDILKNLSNY